MVDASDVKESIQASTLYGFSDYDYIDNNKCYNFFDYDWFKKLLFSANSLAKTSCSLIRSVIILVTKKNRTPAAWSSDFVITRTITDRTGLHSVLLPLLITRNSKWIAVGTECWLFEKSLSAWTPWERRRGWSPCAWKWYRVFVTAGKVFLYWAIFPRFNSVPTRKPDNMQQPKSLLSQWLMNSTLTYIFVEFLTRTFPEYSITKKCLNRMIAFIRESNVLVKNFDGKHQQSLVKSPANSCNFTDRKEYEPLCFLIPQFGKILTQHS